MSIFIIFKNNNYKNSFVKERLVLAADVSCPKYRKFVRYKATNLHTYSILVMVLIVDGNSEHVAHARRKKGWF